jgi:hypothetical protein
VLRLYVNKRPQEASEVVMLHLTKIIPNLYTRGKLRTGTPLSTIEEAGLKCVVSLIDPGEPTLVGWPGYVHWPMSDGSLVDEERLTGIVDVIVENLRWKKATLVMCRAGRNRTGLVVCAVLRERLGISGREALDLFRERRPRGVANPTFEKYLLSLPTKNPH